MWNVAGRNMNRTDLNPYGTCQRGILIRAIPYRPGKMYLPHSLIKVNYSVDLQYIPKFLYSPCLSPKSAQTDGYAITIRTAYSPEQGSNANL